MYGSPKTKNLLPLRASVSNATIAHTNSDPHAQTHTAEPALRTNPTNSSVSKPGCLRWVIVHTDWTGGYQVVSKNKACLREGLRRFAAVNYLAPLPRLQTSITQNTLSSASTSRCQHEQTKPVLYHVWNKIYSYILVICFIQPSSLFQCLNIGDKLWFYLSESYCNK